MEFKDYYSILGVPPEADEKTIKQAYRKLARQYHPDVNPNNKEAEEKFKEINEAYQVLSNADQRAKYDQMRLEYQQYQRSGGRPQNFNWQQWGARPEEGVHYEYATPEDMEDLFGAESPYSDFFTSMFGQARGREGRRPAHPRRGRDIEQQVDITLEEAYHGTQRILQMDGRRIEARIPPGVRTGSRVRLSGQGEPGRNGGASGDLYLVIHVLPSERFEREGDDLYTDVPVDIFTAVGGGEVQVPTMERPVMLKIPPKTNADRSFRLRGKGIPHLSDSKTHGDLYARVKLVLPPMTDKEVNAIREIATSRQHS